MTWVDVSWFNLINPTDAIDFFNSNDSVILSTLPNFIDFLYLCENKLNY